MLLEHSLEAHPYLKSLEKTKEEKKATSNAYLSRFFPSTSASFTASKVNDYSKLQTVLGLSATQKIIDLGAAQDLTVAKSNYTLADYQKQLGHDYVQAKVEFTFLAAWLQTQRKDVIESLKKSSYSTFQRAQAQFNAGTTSRNDLMVAAAIHATNLKTIEQYENELDDAFVALEKATNLSFRKNKIYENLEWNPHKNIDIPNIKTALQQASVNRKELYVNSQEADSAKQQELAYKKDYLPTLGLYGTWQRRQDSTATDPYNAHEAGLAASWNFFDGGNSYFNSQAYHARNLRLHEDRLATLQTIDSEVRSAHHSLLVNLRDLQLKDVQLSKEKDTFEQQKSRFESGLLVQSEYDAAIYTWNTAQINWLQQKINAETARKVLEAKCGYPK
ncbi:TolC family protein [Candidatus Babeliales bacterium]|nr:TolC family protein [Candidatus Babeliales bacterium]